MKYIDLKAEIQRMRDSLDTRVGIVAALNWLDEHPDQVPGRTITESRFNQAVDIAMDSGDFDTEEFARQLGTTIIPDPGPTNAEKLRDELNGFRGALREAGISIGFGATEALAEALDARGVKAPEAGGDDEQ